MDAALELLIWERAGRRCEYCGMPAELDDLPFQIDHVIAIQHGGRALASNTALACAACNRFKGPNLSGIDGRTGRITRLFHPGATSGTGVSVGTGQSLSAALPSG